jgi:hypothetical protein
VTDSDDAFIAWRDVRRKHWIAARKAEYLQHGNIDEQLAERLATQDWDNGPGQGRTATSGIEFEGGPEDGNVLHGLGARIIEGVDPPFVCFSIDGRYEHYVRVVGEPRFVHVEACHTLALEGAHPDCGHDHDSDW